MKNKTTMSNGGSSSSCGGPTIAAAMIDKCRCARTEASLGMLAAIWSHPAPLQVSVCGPAACALLLVAGLALRWWFSISTQTSGVPSCSVEM